MMSSCRHFLNLAPSARPSRRQVLLLLGDGIMAGHFISKVVAILNHSKVVVVVVVVVVV
jgi:hypothetical protein